MREFRTYGSVRGASGNGRPYRDPTILRNLYAFLVDQNYLVGNPWKSVTVPSSAQPRIRAGRSFTVAQWAFIEQQLLLLVDTSCAMRLRFALHLLYATGLRLSEVTAAKVDDLRWVEYPGDEDDPEPLEGWLLVVVGKGQREREVPVPIDVVSELSGYLESRGLDPDPEDAGNAGVYLLGRATDWEERAPGLAGRKGPADLRTGIADNTLADQLKGFFEDCGDVLQGQGDAKGAERLRSASTHWLRHTCASHAIARGMKVEIAQQNLGHASLATTTIYVTTEQKRRLKAVETVWAKRR
jgi:site-specific recombinase XerD